MPNKTIEEILKRIGDLPVGYKQGGTEIVDFDYFAGKVLEIRKGVTEAYEAGRLQGLNEALEVKPEKAKDVYPKDDPNSWQAAGFNACLTIWAHQIKSLIDKK